MTDKTGELVEFAGKKIPREMISLISNFLENKDLLSLSVTSKNLHEACESLLRERKILSEGGEDENPEVVTIPKLSEVLPQQFPLPVALGTTIHEVTTVSATGTSTFTFPENSQIVVPILPECLPLVAKVPDVYTEEEKKDGEPQEVKISQILPGYLPSYANDYVPSEVDNHSYNTFVNTMSFNVSRYPALADVTDSKNYTKKKDPEVKEQKADESKSEESDQNPKFEYVPAEYFKGPESSFQTAQMKTSQSITMVNPEVLSSGRILTNMTIPTLTSLERREDDSVLSEPKNVAGKSGPLVETTHVHHGADANPIVSASVDQSSASASAST